VRPAEGVALGDRYRLVERIAVGGMGEVWRAHDDALARDVAVKVLREEYAGDEGFLERFRTEARNCAQLSHPNIAQLYDYGEQEGSAFLVMELILGEPLSDLLDREPVLPTRRLLPILAETARALHAAHVAGVVHRDVKPGNIILSRSGRVKITDFGISTATGRIPMTDSGMVMGTAQYLSPEQAIGKAATPASDIYSLGIVAYEALVGHRPFTGPTAVDIAIAHVNTPVPPMPADVDPELSALVMRMLAKDPEERPRSAASLARVLDEIAVRTPASGIPVAQGRHARPVDVVDALTAAGDSTASFPTVARPDDAAGAPAGTGGMGAGDGPRVERRSSTPPAGIRSGRRADRAPEPVVAGVADAPQAPAGPGRGRLAGLRHGLVAPLPATNGVSRRWRWLTRPLVALLLMVLFALLGAAFADSLWGRSRSAPSDDAGNRILVMASPDSADAHGIIDRNPDRVETTARDQ
jgi:predicted Ser/Thr protein kinase